MNKQTFYTLSNGVKIPAAGYGTYKAADGKSAPVGPHLGTSHKGTRTDSAAFFFSGSRTRTEAYVGSDFEKYRIKSTGR